MMPSTPPETTSKFTPEQRLRLGQVYAMILRWNHEDELLRGQQTDRTSSTVGDSEDSAVLAGFTKQEG
jgi:hypothetical protein